MFENKMYVYGGLDI
jgi:hypothetical protein